MFSTQRPTVCVTGAGVDVDSAWEQEKLEARKCSKMRLNPQRPVHAVLGGDKIIHERGLGMFWINIIDR